MHFRRLIGTLAVSVSLLLSFHSEAKAQHRGGGRHGSYSGRSHSSGYRYRPSVGVYLGSGFYAPFWDLYYGYYGPWGFWGPSYYAPPYDGVEPGDEEIEVRLQVKPASTEVYVDGYRAGVVDDYNGLFERLRLPPGDHEIVLYLEGYRTVRKTLSLSYGAS